MKDVADQRFCLGLATLLAAGRLERAVADDETKAKFGRLAVVFRERGQAFMMEDAAQRAIQS